MAIIYALFDDGNQSVKKALEPLGHKVYSFGIQEKDTVIQTDLTNLENFYNTIYNLPKPDFLFANPPCETFSKTTSGTFASGRTGNKYYYYDNLEPILDFEDWKTSNNSNIVMTKRKEEIYKKSREVLKLNEQLHKNTELIASVLNVPFVIENPRTSLVWKKYYLEDRWHNNDTIYTAYSLDFSRKPTRFKSNVKLNLKTKALGKSDKTMDNIRDYNIKSKVPNELIIHILEELQKNEL